MTENVSPMLERLQEFLKTRPHDSFVRYGLAMEYSKLGRSSDAMSTSLQLIDDDPDYVAAYLQAGIALTRDGRIEEAQEVYRKGIETAARMGESHALGELQGALAN